jgi:hypothetical protein
VKYHCWALEWQRHDKMAPSPFIVSTERDADDVYDGDFCKEEDLLLSKENTKRENGINSNGKRPSEGSQRHCQDFCMREGQQHFTAAFPLFFFFDDVPDVAFFF